MHRDGCVTFHYCDGRRKRLNMANEDWHRQTSTCSAAGTHIGQTLGSSAASEKIINIEQA